MEQKIGVAIIMSEMKLLMQNVTSATYWFIFNENNLCTNIVY